MTGINPDGRTARLAVALATLIPSVAAGRGAYVGLDYAGAPESAAMFIAALIAVIGVITITHRTETLIRRLAANPRENP